MNAVEVIGLRKAYDGVEAVRGIDFELHAGEVFGGIFGIGGTEGWGTGDFMLRAPTAPGAGGSASFRRLASSIQT